MNFITLHYHSITIIIHYNYHPLHYHSLHYHQLQLSFITIIIHYLSFIDSVCDNYNIGQGIWEVLIRRMLILTILLNLKN